MQAATITNAGGRDYNEDSARDGLAAGLACWVVADGLGAHGGGDIASAAACRDAIAAFLHTPGLDDGALARYVAHADEAVRREQAEHPEKSRMRTTFACLVAGRNSAAWAHVGDTRIYHLRAGRIVAQTRDHSVPQHMVNVGEISAAEIRNHESRNRLLRALGDEEAARPALAGLMVLTHGDAFMLCTDGFWEHVLEGEIEADFAKSTTPAEWLAYLERRLQARVSGGFDNYTATAVLGDDVPVRWEAPLAPAVGAPAPHRPGHRLVQAVAYVLLPLLLLGELALVLRPQLVRTLLAVRPFARLTKHVNPPKVPSPPDKAAPLTNGDSNGTR